MKVGINIFPVAIPELGEVAVLAEELGYHSLWYGEHVAVPLVFDASRYPGGKPPFAPDTPFLDPFTVFGYLGGLTKKIRFGTGIAILPLRDPFLTARAMVGVDRLTNGRLDLGVGTGWLEYEFDVMGRNFAKRGAILNEFLEVLDRLWQDEKVEYHGEHFDFAPMGFGPKPVQQPRIPVIVGGTAPVSLKRAARYDGWYGGADGPKAAAKIVEDLKRYREEDGNADKPFSTSILNWGAPDRVTLDAYEAAGIDQMVVTPWEPWTDRSKAIAGIRDYAASIGLKAS